MAFKPRDPTRHNPGATPALAEPGWSPPGGSGLKASRSTPGALGDLERAYLDAKDAYDASWFEYKRWLDKPHPSHRGLEWDSPEFRAYREGMRNAAGASTAAQQRLSQARINLKRGRALPQYLKGEGGFMRGVAPSARSTAARGLSTALGVAASPIIDYALDPESRTPVQFARSQEEAITGMVPGLVSPSELPPPAALPPDRLKAVEATQGMVGVAQDFESGIVTEQEVRAYVANKFAKGEKLPEWADKITSMKSGRLVIKPVNPRSKARQKAAAAPRPHNPRMGQTKRKHGGY